MTQQKLDLLQKTKAWKATGMGIYLSPEQVSDFADNVEDTVNFCTNALDDAAERYKSAKRVEKWTWVMLAIGWGGVAIQWIW